VVPALGSASAGFGWAIKGRLGPKSPNFLRLKPDLLPAAQLLTICAGMDTHRARRCSGA
jgi:hypothetical protein